MKIFFLILVATAFTAHANPLFSMKDRVRMHLWVNGMEEKPQPKKAAKKPLPEEIERALQKI